MTVDTDALVEVGHLPGGRSISALRPGLPHEPGTPVHTETRPMFHDHADRVEAARSSLTAPVAVRWRWRSAA
jgi:hypothetical protein